jgi:hypothetical protein
MFLEYNKIMTSYGPATVRDLARDEQLVKIYDGGQWRNGVLFFSMGEVKSCKVINLRDRYLFLYNKLNVLLEGGGVVRVDSLKPGYKLEFVPLLNNFGIDNSELFEVLDVYDNEFKSPKKIYSHNYPHFFITMNSGIVAAN